MKKLTITEVQELLLDLMKDVHSFMENNNLVYYLIGGSTLGAIRHGGFIPWDDDIDIGMKRDDYERFIAISSQFNNSQYEVANFQNKNNCDFALTRIYINNTYIDNPTITSTSLDKRLYFDIFPLDNVPEDEQELAAFEVQISKKKSLLQKIDARDYGTSKVRFYIKKLISLFLQPFRAKIIRSFDSLMKKYRDTDTSKICSLCSQYSFKKQVMPKAVYGTPALHKFEDSEFYLPENSDQYLRTLYGDNYMEIPPVEKRRAGYDIYLTSED